MKVWFVAYFMIMHDPWNDSNGTFQVTKDTGVFFQQGSGKLSSFSQLSLIKIN